MSIKKKILWVIAYLTLLGLLTALIFSDKSETHSAKSYHNTTIPIAIPVFFPPTDIKYKEMLNVIVYISNIRGSGSGILFYKENSIDNNIYTYYVLTNFHVVIGRKIERSKVDGLRGREETIFEDTGTNITVFSSDISTWTEYEAEVISESEEYDLALAIFQTEDFLPLVKLIPPSKISQVKIFDEVYAVGCQLGRKPIPTKGIISGTINTNHFIGFSHSAQIAPGSSGGGLFKKDGKHYYLIGVPNAVVWYQYQLLPHYAYAISAQVIYHFLNENDLCFIHGQDCQEEKEINNDSEDTG